MDNLKFDTSVYDQLNCPVCVIQIEPCAGNQEPTYRTIYGNEAYEQFLGRQLSLFTDGDFTSLVVNRIPPKARDLYLGAAWRGETHHFQRYNEIVQHFVDVKISPLQEGYVLACYETLLDYTSSKLGCLTQDGFHKRVAEIFADHPDKVFDFIALDIKRFSYYNDTYGYEEGDKILREFVRRAKALLQQDEVIGHISADRFIVLTAHQDFDALVAGHQAYLQGKGQFETSLLGKYRPDVSMGVYVCTPEDRASRSVSSFIDYAISAQKKARSQKGVSAAVFDKELWQRQKQVKHVKETLDTALESGAIQPWFQPQYNFATGKIAGAEVLARWIDPVQGFLSPAEFIPILEESGEVIRLDSFIWDSACKCIRQWLDQGTELPLSINISKRDIASTDIVSHINALTEKYSLPHHLLHLEITETAYMGDTEEVIRIVDHLREDGYEVEMDDFGSGYSSLNMLKDVSVSTLKIDMRFLTNLEENNKARSILSAIMSMAHGMDMRVIAEGVETREQADFLYRIGCSIMQGYYFARPMPKEKFEEIPTSHLEKPGDEIPVVESPMSLDAVLNHSLEKQVNEGINLACQATRPEDSIRLLMAHIGNMLGAERVHLAEIDDAGNYSNTFEWTAAGIPSHHDFLLNIAPEQIRYALNSLASGAPYIVADTQSLRTQDLAYYNFLRERNVHSSVVVPLLTDNRITGLYGVENIPTERIQDIVTVLETVGHFLNTSLRRRDLILTLEHAGRIDALTGLQNRMAFNEQAELYTNTPDIACVVLDVNNLKQCNDRYGHQEGDVLIQDAAQCISGAFGQIGHCYRVGGDEFYVLLTGQTRQTLLQATTELEQLIARKNLTRTPPLSIAYGFEFREEGEDLEHLVVRSDEKMYECKYRMKDEFPVYREEQIRNYLRVLELLSKSTDDYLYLMDIDRDETWFFGDVDQNYAFREPGVGTNSFAQMLQIVYPGDRAILQADVNRIINGTSSVHNLTYRWVNRQGNPVWISCRGKVITDDRGKPFVMVGRVSDTAIKYMVNPMTGLFNESKLIMDIQKDLDMGSFGYLVMFGVTDLGHINQRESWEYGNQCLKDLAAILQESVSGYSVYQVGNVSFAISLVGCGLPIVQRLVEQIRSMPHLDYQIRAGAVSYQAGFQTGEAMFSAGEQALLEARQQPSLSYFGPEDSLL